VKEKGCQMECVPLIAEGKLPSVSGSLRGRLKLTLKRLLSPSVKRQLKKSLTKIIDRFKLAAKSADGSTMAVTSSPVSLKAGDLVRVRSRERYGPHSTLE